MHLEAPVKRVSGYDVVTPYFGRENLFMPTVGRAPPRHRGSAGLLNGAVEEEPMFEFKLPDLGEGIHEGEILKWHVQPGDVVVEDAPLVEVETDKAAVTIPSPRGGKVISVTGEIGDVVATGQVIAVIDDGQGAATPPPPPRPLASPPAAAAPRKRRRPGCRPRSPRPAAPASRRPSRPRLPAP